MKKRGLAILLSVAMCMATVGEAGAAAFDSGEAVSALPGDAEDIFDDGFTSGDGEVTVPETPDTGAEDPTMTPEAPADPEITETPGIIETPDGGDVSDADGTQAEDETKIEDNSEVEIFAAVLEAAGAAMDSKGIVNADISDWVEENGKFKLRKDSAGKAGDAAGDTDSAEEPSAEDDATLPEEPSAEDDATVPEETPAEDVPEGDAPEGDAPAGETPAEDVPEVQPVQSEVEVPVTAAEPDTASVMDGVVVMSDGTEPEDTALSDGADLSGQTQPDETATPVPEEPTQPDETVTPMPEEPVQPDETVTPMPEEPVQPDETVTPAPEEPTQPETKIPEAAGDSKAAVYYTLTDGIIQVKTGSHTGYYLFDENGYMVTGQKTVKPGTAGYALTAEAELYFTAAAKAVLYKEYAGKEIKPWSSDLGQQKKNYWLWTGKLFRFYEKEKGKYVSAKEQSASNKTGYYKINGQYYCLTADGSSKDGTPRTGKIKLSSKWYYFQPAGAGRDIPGQMFHNGWLGLKEKKGERWLYYSPKTATLGQYSSHTILVTKLDTKLKGDYYYMIDKDGFLMRSTMQKASNGYYYGTDKYARIYRNKLVKYGNYRYYFTSYGKRASWKNRWYICSGAGNRFYYFGSVPGRVQEKRGWQRAVSTSGKFYGWLYFDKRGNCYSDRLLNGYYFRESGKIASGLTYIDNKPYFFEKSSTSVHKGKMYKKTLIYCKGKWYYASTGGQLRKSGWQRVGRTYYYFSNLTAVTNKFINKKGVNGYLDGQGKFCTGWVIVSNSKDQVRYIDPDGTGFLRNASKWINGLLYYFDGNGYRINDMTATYRGPYYVEVDRTNGVMTIYNSARNVPVKTIRVSVGLSGTATPAGTYTLYSSLRWQPLMGPSWGQYGTHVSGAGQGGIFVHSVAGSAPNSYSLPAGEYNRLGSPASHGCIRACVADAKWVYYNCNGATIRIFNGKYRLDDALKGPLGRKALVPLRSPYNYDPTDPNV